MKATTAILSVLSLPSRTNRVKSAVEWSRIDVDSSVDGADEVASPSSPSDSALCGNDLCEIEEDASICPADCADLRLKTSDVGGGKGSDGIIFQVRSVGRDVIVTSLDIYSRARGSDGRDGEDGSEVRVYARTGEHSGYESTEEGWDLVYENDSVDLGGKFSPTSLERLGVSVPAGTVASFFVYVPDTIRYDEGTEEGGLFWSDGVLEVYEGVGVRNFFDGEHVFSPRAFTGTIRYDVGFASQPGTNETAGTAQSPTVGVPRQPDSWRMDWATPITCRQGGDDDAPAWNRLRYETKEECCGKGLSWSPSLIETCLSFGDAASASALPQPLKSPVAVAASAASSPSSPVLDSLAKRPTSLLSDPPSKQPAANPTTRPTSNPTKRPTSNPTKKPTNSPARRPTDNPTRRPATPKPNEEPIAEARIRGSSSSIVKKISFVAMGDIPYRKNQRYCLNKQLRELNQEEMDFKFMAHVGDIKGGKTKCYESSFSDIAEMFSHPSNALGYDARDVMFVPGDNEWTDCQNPDQAWRWWMSHFGNGNEKFRTNIFPNEYGFGTLSDPDITVDYQTEPLAPRNSYRSSSANFAFLAEGVLFVGINQVGGGIVGDESTRVANNYQWVEQNMEKYDAEGMRAVVIFAHATMTAQRRQHFGRPFMRLLRERYPDTATLYVHGDGHNFDVGQPDDGNPNLTQLEVDGGDEADPLLISVMHDTMKDKYSFNIDVRGGYYYRGCQFSGHVDKTWSSDY